MVSDSYEEYLHFRRAARRKEKLDISIELWEFDTAERRQGVIVALRRLTFEIQADEMREANSEWGS